MNASRRQVAITALILAACTGCSLAPVNVESRRELIAKLPADLPASPTLPAVLLVFPTGARPVYDTTQMAYLLVPYEIAYFAHSEWAAKPAQMLNDLLVRTLERTARFHAVVTPPYAGAATYALKTDVVELSQDFTAAQGELRMGVRVELRDGGNGRTLTAREFAVREPIAEKSAYAGVVAANEAAARLLRDIAVFVVEKTGRAQPSGLRRRRQHLAQRLVAHDDLMP